MPSYTRKSAVWLLLVAGIFSLFWLSRKSPARQSLVVSTIGNVQTLLDAYESWKAAYIRRGGDQQLLLPLADSKGLSVAFTRAYGQMTVALTNGTVFVEVAGLPPEQSFDVWLISTPPVPGWPLQPAAGEVAIHVGRLQHETDTATLRSQLGPDVLTNVRLVRVAVTRAVEASGEAGVLFGAPSLFQRLYYSEQRGEFAGFDDANRARDPHPPLHSPMSAPFHAVIPSPAYAKERGGTPDIRSALEALIAQGEVHFFQ